MIEHMNVGLLWPPFWCTISQKARSSNVGLDLDVNNDQWCRQGGCTDALNPSNFVKVIFALFNR